jgi:predicted ATPase
LADEKGAEMWKAFGLSNKGWSLPSTEECSKVIKLICSGIDALRSTGATWYVPLYLSRLANVRGNVGELDDAWRNIGEAMTMIQKSKERVWEAEVNRIAGEIALKSREPDPAKAEAYFERALEVARKQQAKSWELRAAMSLARLWRDQGKVQQARELLAPVYAWFTEGFDTRDLKDAKALLEELAY